MDLFVNFSCRFQQRVAADFEPEFPSWMRLSRSQNGFQERLPRDFYTGFLFKTGEMQRTETAAVIHGRFMIMKQPVIAVMGETTPFSPIIG